MYLFSIFVFGPFFTPEAGSANLIGVVAFAVWVALLLAPLFNEISLLGLSLKHEIAELGTTVQAGFDKLVATIKVSNVSQQSVTVQNSIPEELAKSLEETRKVLAISAFSDAKVAPNAPEFGRDVLNKLQQKYDESQKLLQLSSELIEEPEKALKTARSNALKRLEQITGKTAADFPKNSGGHTGSFIGNPLVMNLSYVPREVITNIDFSLHEIGYYTNMVGLEAEGAMRGQTYSRVVLLQLLMRLELLVDSVELAYLQASLEK